MNNVVDIKNYRKKNTEIQDSKAFCTDCGRLVWNNEHGNVEDYMVFSAVPFYKGFSADDPYYEGITTMCQCKYCAKRIHGIDMDAKKF